VITRIFQRLYALKCIRGVSKRILREVDALSSLRSDNVVRYYGAWIERGEIEKDENDNDTAACNNSSFSSEFASTTANNGNDTANRHVEKCNLCHQEYNDWEISYEQWGLIDSVLHPLNLCTVCYKKSLPPNIDASAIDIREKQILPECLYILMEYGGDTLAQVMQEIPNNDDGDTLRWSLFAQCVQGLFSILEKGFYHRDIKPLNIFIKDKIAKIGDLGLSIDDSEIDGNASLDGGSSAGVGTLLYSAPEVDEGRYETVDIYSLGIVLIELFSNFQTGMERVKVLSNIREGKLPEQWKADNDRATLVRSMIDQNPDNRPTAHEILQQLVQKGLLADPDKKVLLKMLTQLQSDVNRLQQIVNDKDEEVKKLRQLLDANGIDVD